MNHPIYSSHYDKFGLDLNRKCLNLIVTGDGKMHPIVQREQSSVGGVRGSKADGYSVCKGIHSACR